MALCHVPHDTLQVPVLKDTLILLIHKQGSKNFPKVSFAVVEFSLQLQKENKIKWFYFGYNFTQIKFCWVEAETISASTPP
jgi:hypothetical protein